jgi:hypothetical protein
MLVAQPASDSIPEKENELTVDLQFFGRGETRYGGMLPEVDDQKEEESSGVAKSSFLLSRKTPTPSRSPLMHHRRLPIHLKPDIPIWFTTSPTASV